MAQDYTRLIEALKPTFEEYEGRSPWLYLDSLGHLTIGVGHLVHMKGGSLDDLETGIKELFPYGILQMRTNSAVAQDYLSSCQAVADGKQKMADAEGVRNRTVKAAVAKLDSLGHYKSLISSINSSSGLLTSARDDGATPGVWGYDLPDTGASESNVAVMVQEAQGLEKLAHGWKAPIVYFRCFNSYQLSEAGIDKLLADDIAAKIKEVKGEIPFKNFDTFPVPAQAAVIDLAFQYGAAGLATHAKFVAAIKKGDWAQAADACPAGVAQAERTQFRIDNLMQAATLANPPAKQTSPANPKIPLRQP